MKNCLTGSLGCLGLLFCFYVFLLAPEFRALAAVAFVLICAYEYWFGRQERRRKREDESARRAAAAALAAAAAQKKQDVEDILEKYK